MKTARILAVTAALAMLTGCNNDARQACLDDGGKIEERSAGIAIINKQPHPITKDVCVLPDGTERAID